MYGFLVALFVIICFFLVVVVLMQSGRGGGLSGAFGGGGGNQTLFGGRGAVDFLGKATWILGGAFMALALILALLSSSDNPDRKSLIEKRAGSTPLAPRSTGTETVPATNVPATPETPSAPASGQDAPESAPAGGDGTTEGSGTSGQ
ncbi:MAG: preprotein translocase subunit SecG [Candidatus Eisenbacteria bacterium]|uniref:Protein-export membrane protein SecG n=1 Tax=Eiseniibacteriota bacterium TaxID=2212470 RepID=A0A956N9R4_UNCEI|nr:preprotein translocase subunit SecG [Candidatus Eisenbacteria bacterium]MCB9462574.1 preprotein translocase subunit SecG [Candidatus Eisenbacteria bacterium]